MAGIDLRLCKASFNWRAIALAAVEIVAQASLFNLTGMVSPVFRALSAGRKDDSVSCKAKKLLIESSVLSIIEAIPKITFKTAPTPAQTTDILNYILNVANTAISITDEPFSLQFQSRPDQTAFFKDCLAPSFLDQLAFAHPTESSEEIAALLSSTFREKMRHLVLSRHTYYREIEDVLSSQIQKERDEEDIWKDYLVLLVQRFEDGSLLGEDGPERIRLSDVYQPLRSVWEQYEVDTENTDSVKSRTPSMSTINMLDCEIDEWLSGFDPKDAIRLISGGPGSGKSTFARKLASQYALKAEWRTLFVPLQRLRSAGPLEDRIEEYFRRQFDEPFAEMSPLKQMRNTPMRNWLIIFDGLDELAGEGVAAANAAQEFATALSDWRSRIGRSLDVRFIVLGRAPSMQDAQRRLDLVGRGTLHVCDMLPQQYPPGKLSDPNEVGQKDQRQDFWRRYAIAKRLDQDVPLAFREISLRDLSKEPLLAYLLIYSGYVENNWQLAAENKNRIYAAIFERIWNREREKDTRKYLNDLGKPCFDALLQALGLAAWHGSGRTGNEETFGKVKKDLLRPALLKKTQNSGADNLENIAVLFYTRRDEEGRQGFEFLHKSFGEYLSGTALANAFFRWANQLANDEDEISAEAFLRRWSSISNFRELDDEVFGFLSREIALLFGGDTSKTERARSIIKSIIEPLDIALTKGFDIVSVDTDFKSISEKQNNSLINLFACLNACGRVAFDPVNFLDETVASWAAGPIAIPSFAETRGFRNFITRYFPEIRTHLAYARKDPSHWPYRESILGSLVSFLDLSGSECSWLTFSQLQFEACKFDRAMFIGCYLDSVSFRSCSIRSSSFEMVSSDVMYFHGCDLSETSFRRADLTRSVFIETDLSSTDFIRSLLSKTAMDLQSAQSAKLSTRQLRAIRKHQLERGNILSKFHQRRLRSVQHDIS